ncbi:hypothetical protein N8787_05955, partial [Opitutaceae bacterium]|nr:hypothetical protein [Opitutaceae bacterium]
MSTLPTPRYSRGDSFGMGGCGSPVTGLHESSIRALAIERRNSETGRLILRYDEIGNPDLSWP